MAAKNTRNRYNELINKSKQDHWENWLEGISAKNVWDMHKFTSAPASNGSKTRIPALRSKDANRQPLETFNNVGKSSVLRSSPVRSFEIFCQDRDRDRSLQI